MSSAYRCYRPIPRAPQPGRTPVFVFKVARYEPTQHHRRLSIPYIYPAPTTLLYQLPTTNYQLPTHQLFNNTYPSQTWYAPLLKRGKGRLIDTTQGKRKSAAKPQGPRKNEPLATIFPCLFCNHEKSVSVKLEKKMGVGTLNCKVCNQQFQCAVNCTFSDPFPFMVLRSKKAQ